MARRIDGYRDVWIKKKEADIQGLFRSGGTHLGKKEKIEGLDDFELICFLVVK